MINYCMSCMEKITETTALCPYCGCPVNFEVPIYHLSLGTILNGKYLVGKAIGEGGFGITYIGRDLNLDIKIAIKEYYPLGYSSRYNVSSNKVIDSPDNKKKDFYIKGKTKFIEEARMLAQFSDYPGIVSARDYFEENNTAYLVMNYLEGKTLKEIVTESGTLSPISAINLLKPVMYALESLHSKGMIHRDISPDNIIVTNDAVKLLDFGAARYFSLNSELSMSVILKHGYTPEEQYHTKGAQGPWTDIYSFCATLYFCITGITPQDSIDRILSDELQYPSTLGINIPTYIENALMKGLSIRSDKRQQNISELIHEFEDNSSVTVPAYFEESFISKSPHQKQNQKKTISSDIIVAICILIALIVAITIITINEFHNNNLQFSQSNISESAVNEESNSSTDDSTMENYTPAYIEPNTAAQIYYYGKINLKTDKGSGNVLNVRNGPGYNYDVIGKIQNGEEVALIKEENGWMYIIYNNIKGWVNINVAGFYR